MKKVYLSPLTKILIVCPSRFCAGSPREQDWDGPGGGNSSVDDDGEEGGNFVRKSTIWDFED